MKDQTTKSSTTHQKSHYTENKNVQRPFFGATPDFFNAGIVQKKESPFFTKTPSNPFFNAFTSPSPTSPVQRQAAEKEAEMQLEQAPVQKKENNTGLPDNLKTGIENLSGNSMDDVKVHRNSDKPAQLQAHAFAQGTDIHLASGQEKHLPHEAWHVVQQKQGRVKPTMQMKGKVNVNDDAGLEKEADVMGEKAIKNVGARYSKMTPKSNNQVGNEVIQRVIYIEKRGKNIQFEVPHLIQNEESKYFNSEKAAQEYHKEIYGDPYNGSIETKVINEERAPVPPSRKPHRPKILKQCIIIYPQEIY